MVPVMRALSSFVLVLAAAGCHREAPSSTRVVATPSRGAGAGSGRQVAAPPASAPAMAAAAPAADAATGDGPADAGCGLTINPARYPAAKRVIAIGDIHGDLNAARAALRAGGAIDAQDAWIGGDLVVVQTGDILDRGDDEQAIIDLFDRLEREAAAAGGAVHWLLGNHELMNAAGDFRYVTAGGMGDFDDAPGLDLSKVPADVPAPMRGRVAALSPGGVYAKVLAEQNVWTIVGDTLFAHAGFTEASAPQLATTNPSARCWLAGKAGQAPPAVLEDSEGPVWTRAWGGDQVDCAALKATLARLGVARMAVGHTVQAAMNDVCGGALWRIDVGLGKNYDGPIQVLEIAGGTARMVAGTRLR